MSTIIIISYWQALYGKPLWGISTQTLGTKVVLWEFELGSHGKAWLTNS
jgi:hypothetical protein